jgi:hypothetical protein
MSATTFNISERAMLAALNVRLWGAKTEDQEAARETEQRRGAKQGTYKTTKILVDPKKCPEYAALCAVRSAARQDYLRMTLAWIPGERIMPSTTFFDLTAKIREHKAKWVAALDTFKRVYPALKAQAKIDQNGAYNESDWPDVDDLDRKCSIRIRIAPLAAPDDFRVQLGAEQEALIRKEHEQDLYSNIASSILDLVARLRDTISESLERIGSYETDQQGKTVKTFRDSAVSNIRETVAIVRKLNFTGDTAIETVCAAIERSLLSQSAQELRDNYVARGEAVAQGQEVLKALGVMEDLFGQQAEG